MKKFLAAMAAAVLLHANTTFAADGVALTLDDAISLALENNRLIEQSAEEREAARWNLSYARRRSGPTLSWSSSLNRIGGPYYNSNRENHYKYQYTPVADYFPSYKNENSNELSLSIPIYTGGQLENQRKGARYALNSADLTLENSRQTVKYQAAAAYFQVLQNASLVNVQQQAVELLQEHLRNVSIQYEVGTVAKADVLATSVQLANTQQSLNTAQGNYQTAVAQLNNILGLPVDTEIAASSEINFVRFSWTEAECLEYALAHRPDGIAASYAVKQAQAQTAAAKGGYQPSVRAVISGNEIGEGVFKSDHREQQWAAGFSLNWNIFDNGVTAAQVEESKAAERLAESRALQQLETIQLEIRTAYVNLKTAEKNIATTADAVAKAEEEFAIAQIRYVEGVDTNLNVMNAQEKVVETRNNYYAALYSFNTSRAQLEKAMGVPVLIDARIYADAEQRGSSSNKALEVAAVENIYRTGATNSQPVPFDN